MQKLVEKIETPGGLLAGAMAVSAHQMPDAKPGQVRQEIEKIASTIRTRVRGSQPQALLAHLHDELFENRGLCGNIEDYYNPLNSYLPAVLETGKGLPITLSLVYKLVADQLGIPCGGLGLPGHFMIVTEFDGAPLLIDPFHKGQALSRTEAIRRVHESFGDDVDVSPDLLEPVSNRAWITRVLQNLLHAFGSAGQYVEVAAMLELEMLLWPKQAQLQRDLGLVLARAGMAEPATQWLNHYLRHNPSDPQKQDLTQLLEALAG
jgi:regulator of sirC expression with transglutaminase-like and TPR domain